MSSLERFYLILHGHFYQPPREDPWIGEIDRQESAYPNHDWNDRVNEECYAANSDARFLDKFGHIENITNNYSSLSFTFGPKLLAWLEEYDLSTYKKIINADEVSRLDNDGHGNAIAQVYDHLILPLANGRDKISQIKWGLADFKKRFGRDSEGFWLTETAVNGDTIDTLIGLGIKFIILSPNQVDAVQINGDWKDVSDGSIDTSQAYSLKTSNGEISIFFYDEQLSDSILNGHALTDANNFRDKIISKGKVQNQVKMVNVATPGEIYGYDEPFANMCLAALVNDNNKNKYFNITNYANFLDMFPPKNVVRLKTGKDSLGTSWSCEHGVGRWMEDCGCSIGGHLGWNQKWRNHLRSGLDFLRDILIKLFEEKSAGILEDCWAVRDSYIDVVVDDTEENFLVFCQKHIIAPVTPEKISLVRELLEAQRNAMAMYTSSGWFFSDIASTETIQVIKYAARIFEILEHVIPSHIEEQFLQYLELAVSNDPAFGNGRNIYDKEIKSKILNHERVINQFLLEKFVQGQSGERKIYFYDLKIERFISIKKEDGKVYSGKVSLFDETSYQHENYMFYVLRDSRFSIVSYIKKYVDSKVIEYLDILVEENDMRTIKRKMKDWFNKFYTINDLKFGRKELLVRGLFKRSYVRLYREPSNRLDEYLELLEFYEKMHLPVPNDDKASIEFILNKELFAQLRILEKKRDFVNTEKVVQILSLANKTNLVINKEVVNAEFKQRIKKSLAVYLDSRDTEDYLDLINFVDFSNQAKLFNGRKDVEDVVFTLLQETILPILQESDPVLYKEEKKFIDRILKLAEQLNIRVFEFKELVDRNDYIMEDSIGRGK